MAFTKSLAQSVGPDVRVKGIAPGWIKTAWGRARASIWTGALEANLAARSLGNSRRHRICCFLACGPTSEFINGQIIEVNGGWKRLGS